MFSWVFSGKENIFTWWLLAIKHTAFIIPQFQKTVPPQTDTEETLKK